MKKVIISIFTLLAAASYGADSQNSEIVTELKGKIEFKATGFFSMSQKDNYEYSSFLGVPVNDDGSFSKFEKTYEPYSTAEFTGKLWNTIDTKLILKENKDNDSSHLIFSKDWSGNYFEWDSYINFAADDLFPALFRRANIKIKKTMKYTEGQLKTKINGTSVETVDENSSDTYIKMAPYSNLDFTFRPYDINWRMGKEFVNENLDRNYFGYNDGDTLFVSEGIFFKKYGTGYSIFDSEDRSDNLDNDNKPTPGVEVNMKMSDAMKIYLATNTNFAVKKDDKTTKTVTNESKFLLKGALNMNMTSDTSLFAGMILKTGNTKKEINSNTASDSSDSYIGINANLETKMDRLKVNGEIDIRTEGNEEKQSKLKNSGSRFAIYGKGTFDIGEGISPYGYMKLINSSTRKESGGTTINDYGRNLIEIAGGIDYKVEALTLNGELKIASFSSEEKKSGAKIEGSAFGLGGKVTYEF